MTRQMGGRTGAAPRQGDDARRVGTRASSWRDASSAALLRRAGAAAIASIVLYVGGSLPPSLASALASADIASARLDQQLTQPTPDVVMRGARMQLAQADLCENLWRQRNGIYRAAGYCFRTQRAIAVFGNAGCQYDHEADVPLSAHERHQIRAISSQERRLGCPP